jgi:hypothetical protein
MHSPSYGAGLLWRARQVILPTYCGECLGTTCGNSCAYAAVALARSIFRKGADFTAINHSFVMN